MYEKESERLTYKGHPSNGLRNEDYETHWTLVDLPARGSRVRDVVPRGNNGVLPVEVLGSHHGIVHLARDRLQHLAVNIPLLWVRPPLFIEDSPVEAPQIVLLPAHGYLRVVGRYEGGVEVSPRVVRVGPIGVAELIGIWREGYMSIGGDLKGQGYIR